MAIWRNVYGRAYRALRTQDPIIKSVKPYTLLTEDRLESLLRLSKRLVRARIPGAFVECGTFRGGSAAILAYTAKRERWKRNLYLFDSFQGHPSFASAEAPDRDEIRNWAGKLVATEEDVKAALRTVNAYDPEHVTIVPGWFQQSLSTVTIPKIALLHLDADWYDSTLFCLQVMFHRVVPGGYIQIDDYYYYEGCRLAVDKFFAGKERISFKPTGLAVVVHKK